jgi:hypothetical protein
MRLVGYARVDEVSKGSGAPDASTRSPSARVLDSKTAAGDNPLGRRVAPAKRPGRWAAVSLPSAAPPGPAQ